jgi:nitroreductase
MKRLLKIIIPGRVIKFVRTLLKLPEVLKYYPRDIRRYLTHSAALIPNKCFDNLNAKVIADSHIIEKGLSLKNPRLGFGKAVLQRLQLELKLYHQRGYDTETFAYKFGVSVLYKYVEFNEDNGYDVSELRQAIIGFSNSGLEDFAGGRQFTKVDIKKLADRPFPEFINGRVSLRQFSGEPVDIEKVIKSVDLARRTPSVCNRQSSRVYVLENEEMKNKVIEIQHGNRGFGDQVDKVLIVCSDLSTFFGLQERHQAYIDGGLFGMTLLYALSYYQVGACALNWCTEAERDRQLRDIVPVKNSEEVLMVIAIGSIPDSFRVAKSPRKNICEVCSIV